MYSVPFSQQFFLQKVRLNQPIGNTYQVLFFRIPEGKFCPQQSISSGNELKITVTPTYHSLCEQVGDTDICEKKDLGNWKS